MEVIAGLIGAAIVWWIGVGIVYAVGSLIERPSGRSHRAPRPTPATESRLDPVQTAHSIAAGFELATRPANTVAPRTVEDPPSVPLQANITGTGSIVTLGRQTAYLRALIQRVGTVTQSDADKLEEFCEDPGRTEWSRAAAKKSKSRALDAISHANIEEQWVLVGELIETALSSSPLASKRTSALPLVRRAARWAALALIVRHFRDELTWGYSDYAILTLPWTWSIGALHPSDLAEDPWSDFSGARLELPGQSPPVLVSARLPDPALPALRPVQHGLFHVRYWLGDDGKPVGSDDDEDRWLAARRTGVGASEVGKIVKANGAPSVQRAGLLQRKLDGDPGHHFAAYDHGVEREPIIARWVNDKFAITHNAHLCMGQNPRHIATPDGIGDGVICEIKTSVVPLAKAVRRYRDQLQWQLHVTASPQVLFVVENRDTLEREYRWVGRDEDRIATLVAHTNDFLVELDTRLKERDSGVRPIAARRVVRFEES